MSKDREITSTRRVTYSQAEVYQAWSNPDLLAQWWGPKGFTNTFHAFDLKPGGTWQFTMHSPQGPSFDNKCVFVEIVPNKRLVFDHVEPVHAFQVIVTFDSQSEDTLITFRMVFKSVEECAKSREVIEPSNEENFDRLEALLARHFNPKV
jgi:uncharacterized protein YndB with AHSA1/START domain